MRLIINLVLVALVFLLIYVLYSSINEPIAFQAERDIRETAVENRLIDIRKAQEIYRDVTGKFANNFDDLVNVVKTGKVPVVKVIGDPDDPTNTEAMVRDTTFESASQYFADYAKVTAKRNIDLDSLRYVPFTQGEQFTIDSDTLTYQSTLVNVTEVGVQREKFMGPYSDPRFRRYDPGYDPKGIIKFGTMSAPNLAGNWER